MQEYPVASRQRREFLKSTAAAVACGSLAGLNPSSTLAACQPVRPRRVLAARPVFIATWNFGKAVCDEAMAVLTQGKSMPDAIESGIRLCEADASNSSVGIGGTPNSDGVVQLDAVFMTGPGHRAGSVGGLEDIAHPISVARAVMEKTDHVLLVGAGARKFAIEQGHLPVDLLTEDRRRAWEQWKSDQQTRPPVKNDHDTITLLGVDEKGDIYGGCSTSGRGYKLPGRVGDSPIVGAGLYVDNAAGAAGATGIGENVMRYCGSFLIVEFMRNGASPEEACLKTIQRIAEMDPLGIDKLEINFIAINKAGEFGAAGTSKGFQYALTTRDASGVHDATIATAN
jgi:isoaspartyl peptidase/L-asparaginase-like protein (Ntn-hydrolase superfamily)